MEAWEGGFDCCAWGEAVKGVVEATEEDDFAAGWAEGAEGVVALGDVVLCGGVGEGLEEEVLGFEGVLGGCVYPGTLGRGVSEC